MTKKSQEIPRKGLTSAEGSVTDLLILGVVRPGFCENCLVAPVQAKGRCSTCGDYLRRTGEERPEELILRSGEREIEKEATRRANLT